MAYNIGIIPNKQTTYDLWNGYETRHKLLEKREYEHMNAVKLKEGVIIDDK